MTAIVVADDFYKEPYLVRELALEASYQDVRHLNYPGLQSQYSFHSPELIAAFEEALGEKINPNIEALTFGRFRFMTEDSGGRIKIHVDGGADWTGLIYLNPPEQCEGGTAFYRHKVTGLEGPPSPEKMSDFGFADALDFEKKIIEQDSLNLDKWEQTHFIGMRFNRLVLFRGNELFHCHTHGFGNSHKNSRLTQNFFFNSLDQGKLKDSIYAKGAT